MRGWRNFRAYYPASLETSSNLLNSTEAELSFAVQWH